MESFKSDRLTLVSSLSQNSGDVKARDQVEQRQLDASLDGRPGELLVARSLEARCPGKGNLIVARLHPDGPWVRLVRPVGDHKETSKTKGNSHDGVDDEEPPVGFGIR